LIVGCSSSAPLPPAPTSAAELKPAQAKTVRQGNRKVQISVRDHDEESVSERFARRAREQQEKAGQ
jgi:hypothetical protein